MKVPEKIYIASDEGFCFDKSDSEIAWSYKPPFDSIEYIRKDIVEHIIRAAIGPQDALNKLRTL
jgi:hypothetical protein